MNRARRNQIPSYYWFVERFPKRGGESHVGRASTVGAAKKVAADLGSTSTEIPKTGLTVSVILGWRRKG
jgi:hypothetical protein